MTSLHVQKLAELRNNLRKTGGCAVAYSGGVDSSLLLAVAREVLGERCLAVNASSSTYARRESRAAIEWVRQQGIPFVVVESEELDIPAFRDNPPDRCYYCKKELFAKVREQALARGLRYIADGTNADDTLDYRPGMRAAQELGVLTPLLDAGLTKDDIRVIAREAYQLPMADKPAMACMASRFPYRTAITPEKLRQVEEIEAFLAKQGFEVYRARHHDSILRLELGPAEMERLQDPALRRTLVQLAKAQGFPYVTVDLEGYRMGSMNRAAAPGRRRVRATPGAP